MWWEKEKRRITCLDKEKRRIRSKEKIIRVALEEKIRAKASRLEEKVIRIV